MARLVLRHAGVGDHSYPQSAEMAGIESAKVALRAKRTALCESPTF